MRGHPEIGRHILHNVHELAPGPGDVHGDGQPRGLR